MLIDAVAHGPEQLVTRKQLGLGRLEAALETFSRDEAEPGAVRHRIGTRRWVSRRSRETSTSSTGKWSEAAQSRRAVHRGGGGGKPALPRIAGALSSSLDAAGARETGGCLRRDQRQVRSRARGESTRRSFSARHSSGGPLSCSTKGGASPRHWSSRKRRSSRATASIQYLERHPDRGCGAGSRTIWGSARSTDRCWSSRHDLPWAAAGSAICSGDFLPGGRRARGDRLPAR